MLTQAYTFAIPDREAAHNFETNQLRVQCGTHTQRINKPPLDGLGDGLDCHSFQSMSLCLIKWRKKGCCHAHKKEISPAFCTGSLFYNFCEATFYIVPQHLPAPLLSALDAFSICSSFGLHIFSHFGGVKHHFS